MNLKIEDLEKDSKSKSDGSANSSFLNTAKIDLLQMKESLNNTSDNKSLKRTNKNMDLHN